MPEYSEQSLLPGAPTAPVNPWDQPKPVRGIFAMDLASSRLGGLPVQVDVLWDPDQCPAEFLPWLAWALSVDEWDVAMSEAQKREAIRQSKRDHEHKGSAGSVRRILDEAGFAAAELKEGFEGIPRDGSFKYNGLLQHDSSTAWALFAVIVEPDESGHIVPQVAEDVIEKLKAIAPARCRFLGFSYRGSAEYSEVV